MSDDFPERLCHEAKTKMSVGTRLNVSCAYLPYNENSESTENIRIVRYEVVTKRATNLKCPGRIFRNDELSGLHVELLTPCRLLGPAFGRSYDCQWDR
jgi:hypothetical protein